MLSKKSKLQFFFETKVHLNHRTQIKMFIERLFAKEGISLGRLVYVFTIDRSLLKLNREWLNHNDYTDILTFDLSTNGRTIGEIYISVERVKENAISQKTSFKNELLRVMIHGALHLCGYQDKNPDQKRKIRSREDFYLDQFHVKLSKYVPREK
jgi:rRNA maturation RNase YbeY